MGYRRLSETDIFSIAIEDTVIGISTTEGLGRFTIKDLLNLFNSNFDVTVEENEEYKLRITIGEKIIETPNLKPSSIEGAHVERGHLYLEMSGGKTIDAGYLNNDVAKYGVCYDFKSKNPKLTRIGDAKYMRAEISDGKDDTQVVNDFDNVYPWCDIKRCTVATDGTVTSYEGDPNYIEDGSIGEVLTEIPEHYEMKYISEETGKMYYYVSREKLNEHYKYVPKMYIGSFLMTTNADDVAESRAGALYYHDRYSYKNAQAAAKAKGSGWHQFDIWEYETIKTLFMIEFATLDSQSIYPGNDSVYAPEVYAYPNEECAVDFSNETENVTDTEFTTDYFVSENDEYEVGDEVDIEVIRNDNPEEFDYEDEGNYYVVRTITSIEPVNSAEYPDLEDWMSIYHLSGSPITIEKEVVTTLSYGRNGQFNRVRDKASSSKFPYYGCENCGFVYRGIENFLSVQYTWIDGILLHDGKYWVCDDVDKYANSIYAYNDDGNITEEYQYIPLSFECPSTTGYITKMGYDEATGLTLPSETGGASNIAYCDYFTKQRVATSTYTVRWSTDKNTQSGLFYMSCTLTPSNSTTSSARLSYRHS